MKQKHISFILGLLFCATLALQAQDLPGVAMSFTLDNGKGRTQVVMLGAKDGATTGIDEQLGESELPPKAPAEIFDARVTSMPGKSQLGTGSLADFRPITNKTAPFTMTFAVEFQGGVGCTSVKLMWDQPYPGRISKVTVDGADVATKTEVASTGAQGQFTIELTIDFRPLGFTANPSSLSFVAGNRDPLPTKSIEITTQGDTQAPWQIVPGEAWLSASPSMSSGRQTIDVSINTNQIPTGTYNTVLQVRGITEQASLDIPVTLIFTVGVDEVLAPNGMRLRQNYPNPFTSTTAFDVDLGPRTASTAPVLKIYDTNGREVANLSARLKRSSGYQAVTFDAGDLPAGMYTCSLSYDGHELTRTMVLAR
jgi:hypothetical protein